MNNTKGNSKSRCLT